MKKMIYRVEMPEVIGEDGLPIVVEVRVDACDADAFESAVFKKDEQQFGHISGVNNDFTVF